MSTVTYDNAAVAAGAARVSGANRPGFWSRMFERLADARLAQARAYIARHSYLQAAMERDGAKR
jgi:hypothetical protein